MTEMTGADSTERSNRAKAIPSNTDKGVAGRSMLTVGRKCPATADVD
jgi:hypothetical protein